MKAMVLCAGLGTRLRPFTERWPKPAMPFLGQPLFRYHLAVLRAAGLIVPERKGKFIEYDVNTTVLQEVIELLLDAVPDRRYRWRSNAARSLASSSRSPRR